MARRALTAKQRTMLWEALGDTLKKAEPPTMNVAIYVCGSNYCPKQGDEIKGLPPGPTEVPVGPPCAICGHPTGWRREERVA